jgi:hypothetical protein
MTDGRLQQSGKGYGITWQAKANFRSQLSTKWQCKGLYQQLRHQPQGIKLSKIVLCRWRLMVRFCVTSMQSVIGYQASRRNCEIKTKVKLVTFPEQVVSRVQVMRLINKLD